MRANSSAIVTINGWLYLLGGLLGLLLLKKIDATNEQIVVFVNSFLFMAVGGGLLLRRNWARWLTLGISLVTWALGALALILLIAKLLKMDGRSSFEDIPWFVVPLVICVSAAIVIWLNYRLFDRLNSDEGRDEFNTPSTEANPIVRSAAAYVGWLVVASFLSYRSFSGHGSPSTQTAAAYRELAETRERAATRETSARAVEQMHEAPQRREFDESTARDRQEQIAADPAQRQVEQAEGSDSVRAAADSMAVSQQEFQRKSRELFERRARDSSYTDAQFQADQDRLSREFRQSINARQPDSGPAIVRPSISETRSPSPILKCRDSSGAISFTQGFCPAGTTRVEMPKAD